MPKSQSGFAFSKDLLASPHAWKPERTSGHPAQSNTMHVVFSLMTAAYVSAGRAQASMCSQHWNLRHTLLKQFCMRNPEFQHMITALSLQKICGRGPIHHPCVTPQPPVYFLCMQALMLCHHISHHTCCYTRTSLSPRLIPPTHLWQCPCARDEVPCLLQRVLPGLGRHICPAAHPHRDRLQVRTAQRSMSQY